MSKIIRAAAIILAAGYSSRMGEFKPLLPLGNSRVIERAVRCFLRAGIDDIIVVVGHRSGELIPVVTGLGARIVVNPDYPRGMYSSVRSGVREMSRDSEAFFLLPGDHPLVRPETLARLLEVYRETDKRIVYPCFEGRRGHPPLITAAIRQQIVDCEPTGGLRMLLEDYQSEALDLRVEDGGVLVDMDTPGDYDWALKHCSEDDVPDEETCLFLLKQKQVPVTIVAHSLAVAGVAGKIATSLKRQGLKLDLNLVRAAALLHDIAKEKPDHPQIGQKLLVRLGYPGLATIVGAHMDLKLGCGETGEAEVVYLSDKLVKGTSLVSLEERFGESLNRYGQNPFVAVMVTRRLENAGIIKNRIEQVLGVPIKEILNR